MVMNCPNPTCSLQFPDNDSVCAHLAQPDTVCWDWTQVLLDQMIQGTGRNSNEEQGEEDEEREREEEEYGAFSL